MRALNHPLKAWLILTLVTPLQRQVTSEKEDRSLPWPATTARQEPDAVPEMPVVPVHPASPNWKEPVLGYSQSSGEPVGSVSGGYMNWGSPRLQVDFGPMDYKFADWTSYSRLEEAWEWGPTQEQEKVLYKMKDE